MYYYKFAQADDDPFKEHPLDTAPESRQYRVPPAELFQHFKELKERFPSPEEAALFRDVVYRTAPDFILDAIYDYESADKGFFGRVGGRLLQNPNIYPWSRVIAWMTSPFRTLMRLGVGPHYDPLTNTVYMTPAPFNLSKLRSVVEHEFGHAMDYNRLIPLHKSEGVWYPMELEVYEFHEPVFLDDAGPFRNMSRELRSKIFREFPILGGEILANLNSFRLLGYALRKGFIKPKEAIQLARERLPILSWALSTYAFAFGLNKDTLDAVENFLEEEGLKFIRSKEDYKAFQNLSDEEILQRLNRAGVEYEKDLRYFLGRIRQELLHGIVPKTQRKKK